MINSLLLYYLFKYFIHKRYAAILALVFAVHPAHEITVAYIANLQDVLFFFFGIIALLILVYKYSTVIRRLLIVSLLLLCSLLSKETGILFVGISFLYVAFFNRKLLAKTFLSFFTLFTVYSVLRAISSFHPFMKISSDEVRNLNLLERLVIAPKLIFYYLKEAIIPSDTINLASQLSKNTQNEIPLLIGLFAVVFLLIMVMKNIKKSKYFLPALFFICWYISGVGMHLQIIPLDNIASKRWLYFPLAGLLGFIGILVAKLNLNTRYEKYLLLCCLVIIAIFSIQTFQMNAKW